MEVVVTATAWVPTLGGRPSTESQSRRVTGSLEQVLIDADRLLHGWGSARSRDLGLIEDEEPEYLPFELPYWFYVMVELEGSCGSTIEVEGDVVRIAAVAAPPRRRTESDFMETDDAGGMLGFLVELDEELGMRQPLEPLVGGAGTWVNAHRPTFRMGAPLALRDRLWIESLPYAPENLDEILLLALVRRAGTVSRSRATELTARTPGAVSTLLDRGLLTVTRAGRLGVASSTQTEPPTDQQLSIALVRHARRRGCIDREHCASLLQVPPARAARLIGGAVDRGELMPWGRARARSGAADPLLFVPLAGGVYPFETPPQAVAQARPSLRLL